jgi:tripartite-type tricarboxylate transporter receptor subunit TctC
MIGFRAALCAVSMTLTAVASAPPAAAQAVADFYRGNTIRIVVGFGAGGGYDLYSRVAAQYLGKFIPGNPQIIVQNMAGAGGRRATRYVDSAAPKDGTVLGMPSMHLALEMAMGDGQDDTDPKRFLWIGRLSKNIDVGLSWHTSAIKTLEDATKRDVVVASSGPISTSTLVALALNRFYGTRFKVVHGYQGSNSFAMAMIRGEADAQSAIGWTTIKSRFPEWLSDRKVNLLWQLMPERDDELSQVPAIVEFGKTPLDKAALGLIASGGQIGRTLFAPAGTPPDRVAALRKALIDMCNDAAIVAELKSRHIDLEPLAGDQLAELMTKAAGAPKEVIDRVKWATAPDKAATRDREPEKK